MTREPLSTPVVINLRDIKITAMRDVSRRLAAAGSEFQRLVDAEVEARVEEYRNMGVQVL